MTFSLLYIIFVLLKTLCISKTYLETASLRKSYSFIHPILKIRVYSADGKILAQFFFHLSCIFWFFNKWQLSPKFSMFFFPGVNSPWEGILRGEFSVRENYPGGGTCTGESSAYLCLYMHISSRLLLFSVRSKELIPARSVDKN